MHTNLEKVEERREKKKRIGAKGVMRDQCPVDKRVASRREKESIRKELGKSRRNIAKKKNTEEKLKRPKI